MTTLKDIAKRVGVSVSTISRVVNNDTSRQINPETKKKIWQVVEELGYIPNESARRLVQNKSEQAKASMQVGCIVVKPQLRQEHPYFSPILSGVNKQLQDLGYSLAYIHSLTEIRSMPLLHKAVLETPLDGMILIGEIDPPILEYIKKHVPATVGIDHSDNIPDIPTVDYDRLAAVKSVVDHLFSQGHRKIGYIGGDTGQDDIQEEQRFIGFKYAMQRAGLDINPDWVIKTEWRVERSYSGMLELIENQPNNLPSAMVSASDMLAIPAMRAVSDKGLRIPEDIAFTGIDNIEISEYTSPPLTTIHVPKYEIGMTSAKLLVQFMNNPQDLPLKILMPFQLIVRQSSVISEKT